MTATKQSDLKWWEGQDQLSQSINPDNLSDLLYCWNQWRASGYRVYFRGENECIDLENQQYPLQPALIRRNILDRLRNTWGKSISTCELERRVFDRFKRHSAHLIEADAAFAGRSMQELEILCLSQHFGLPTRLLDWTLNPFVAIYFALVGDGNFRSYTPSRLWVMVLKNEDDRKDRTIHLENQADFEQHKEVISLEALNEGKCGQDIRTTFTKAPYVVVPLVFTRRIAAQSGRFVYCPHLTRPTDRIDECITRHVIDEETKNTPSPPIPRDAWKLDPSKNQYVESPKKRNSPDTPWECLMCYPIDHVSKFKSAGSYPAKEALLHNLEFRGYHSGRLFPDLSGWAKYIRQGFK